MTVSSKTTAVTGQRNTFKRAAEQEDHLYRVNTNDER